jgi:hypothetical protein
MLHSAKSSASSLSVPFACWLLADGPRDRLRRRAAAPQPAQRLCALLCLWDWRGRHRDPAAGARQVSSLLVVVAVDEMQHCVVFGLSCEPRVLRAARSQSLGFFLFVLIAGRCSSSASLVSSRPAWTAGKPRLLCSWSVLDFWRRRRVVLNSLAAFRRLVLFMLDGSHCVCRNAQAGDHHGHVRHRPLPGVSFPLPLVCYGLLSCIFLLKPCLVLMLISSRISPALSSRKKSFSRSFVVLPVVFRWATSAACTRSLFRRGTTACCRPDTTPG